MKTIGRIEILKNSLAVSYDENKESSTRLSMGLDQKHIPPANGATPQGSTIEDA
jgi:hypothetical protein